MADKIPVKEISFLQDQRNDWKMYIGVLDMSHTKKEIERGNHKRKREVNKEVEQPSTSGLNSAKVPVPEIQISKLRKRNTAIVHEFRSSESESDQDFNGEVDQEYEPPRAAVGRKLYKKVHSYSITDRAACWQIEGWYQFDSSLIF